MSVKKIVKYGTPSLREKSKEVHKISKKIQILVEDLYDTNDIDFEFGPPIVEEEVNIEFGKE